MFVYKRMQNLSNNNHVYYKRKNLYYDVYRDCRDKMIQKDLFSYYQKIDHNIWYQLQDGLVFRMRVFNRMCANYRDSNSIIE